MKFDSDDGIELWLLGWQESHSGGCKVTFQVSADTLDKFRTATVKNGKIAGQRYCALLIELGDDEKPKAKEPISTITPAVARAVSARVRDIVIPPDTATYKGLQPTPPPKPRPPATEAQRAAMHGLCGLAIKWCEDSHFHEWLAFTYPEEWGSVPEYKSKEPTPSDCAAVVVKKLCKIETRKQLDVDPDAETRFRALIMDKYIACRKADGIGDA